MFHAVAPLLESERLRFRAHRPEDFRGVHALWSEPAVYRHTIGRPSSAEECWGRLLRYVGHWTLLGYGFWAIEHKATGLMIGEIGFADFHRTIEPPLAGRCEMGWVLATALHGKGLGSEAVSRIVQWGDEELEQKAMACIIAPDNLPSKRIAEKVGFRVVAETQYNGEPTLLLHRQPR